MRCNSAFPMIPDGYSEVLEIFGNVHNYIRNDGTLAPAWELEQLQLVTLPEALPLSFALQTKVTRIRVHRKLAPVWMLVLGEVHATGLWQELENFGGVFAFRAVRGRPDKLSLHTFGIAGDFDVIDNPLGKTNAGKMHSGIVAIFEKFGFLWGGKYGGRKDTMHFQYAINC